MHWTPELKWWWPGPIGSKYVERVDLVRRLEVGFRSFEGSPAAALEEALMISGDLSIVDLRMVVHYRVHDLTGFLLGVDDPGEPERGIPPGRADGRTLRNAAESTLGHLVGQRSMDDLLYGDRAALQEETRERLQQVLDGYGAGIRVEGVQLFEVGPPGPARAAFDQFLQARQDQAPPIGRARDQAAEMIARAEDQAGKMVAAAEAARPERLRQADEEAARFVSLLREYHREADPARRQGYLEDMEELLPGVAAFIVPLESTP